MTWLLCFVAALLPVALIGVAVAEARRARRAARHARDRVRVLEMVRQAGQ